MRRGKLYWSITPLWRCKRQTTTASTLSCCIFASTYSSCSPRPWAEVVRCGWVRFTLPINRWQLLDGLKASWAGGWFSQPLSHLLNFPVQTDCRAGWIMFNLHWYTTSSTSGSSSGGPAPPARPGWKFSIVYLDVVLSSPCRLCRTCLMRPSQFWWELWNAVILIISWSIFHLLTSRCGNISRFLRFHYINDAFHIRIYNTEHFWSQNWTLIICR